MDKEKEFSQALRYVSLLFKYRLRSCHEIYLVLQKKKYPLDTIEKIVSYLKNHGYLDDYRFTQNYVESALSRGWGYKKIRYKLRKLGIAQELFTCIPESLDTYREVMETLIKRKFSLYQGKKDIKPRVLRFMLARGFKYSDILEVMSKVT